MIKKDIFYIHIDPDNEEKPVLPIFNQMCIASALSSNEIDKVTIYTNNINLNTGFIEEFVNVVKIPDSYMKEISEIGITKIAHKADYIRYKLLFENGGVYSDTDIVIRKNLDNLLDNEMVVSKQSKLQICNGFIMVNPHNEIIKATLEQYKTDYRPSSWTYNSMKVLQDSIDKFGNCKILNYEEGFHYPHFNNLYEFMTSKEDISCDCYCHHLFNSSPDGKKLRKYIEDEFKSWIVDDDCKFDTYISKLMKSIFNNLKVIN